MEVVVSSHNLSVLESFSSPTRIKMIELLGEGPMNIKSLSEALAIKPPIVTRHIQMLEQAGIVRSELVAGKRGLQKLCSLNVEQMVLQFKHGAAAAEEKTDEQLSNKKYEVSIPVGMYSSYNVKPSCGLASETNMLGMCDDPRYFADPVHFEAKVVWFSSGFVEYRIPNYMIYNDQPTMLEFTLEICSETPCSSSNMMPSDIIFQINGESIGVWTYPGKFGQGHGVYTPEWWYKDIHHGIMKRIRVNEHGSFIDGVKVSDVTIDDLALTYDREILLRIGCSSTAKNCGGVTLFGKGFGNYNQDIQLALHCKS